MDKKIKTLIMLLPILLILSLCTPVSTLFDDNMQIVEAAKKKVELNYSKKTLIKGKKLQLKLKNNKKKIKWTSSKKSVATVDKKGKVTARRVGKATITAKVGSKKYKCKITVENPKISSKLITVHQGDSVYLDMEGTNQRYEWKTTDSSIVRIDKYGDMRALNTGTCKIYTKVLGKTFTCEITVKEAFIITEAYKNVTTKEVKTDKGVIVYLKNNYKHDISFTATCLYKNSNKVVIDAVERDVYIPSGGSTALFLADENDGLYEDISYTEYEVIYDVYKLGNVNVVLCNSDISYKVKKENEDEYIVLSNNGKHSVSVNMMVILYKDGKAIDVSENFHSIAPKSSEIYGFNYVFDNEGNLIIPDKYEVIIQEAYYYKD